ncbi:MAG: Uma2 family endonuclease [Gemmatimonadetes bacterium]|nr:Uma2 family endonuclease [Gemmatimonadota bacterium]
MATSRSEAGRLTTLEEFERLPEEDEHLLELSRGILVREPRPRASHGTAVMLLGRHIATWALEHGGIVTAGTGFVLEADPATVRGPDIAWVRPGQTPLRALEGFIHGAPDLAVEVLSPSNRAGEVREKIAQYFEAGTAAVWLVDPKTRTVEVFRSPRESRVLHASDTLDGGSVLPGFAIAVLEIFRF